VFSPAAVGVLKQQFIDTVALSQRDPSFRPSELPFLRNRELASIIPGLDIHDVDAISSSRIHDWINARALAQPNATALSSAERGQSMTYREMTERAHQTARYLQKLGIGRGDAVLLQCDRGFKLVLWIIAILEVGAYYIVIDKDWPLKRKEAIMRVAEPSAVVTDSNRVDTTGAAFGDETKLIVLEKVEAEIAEMPRDMPQVDISNYDLAYGN
jgi:non-ribosomal peptide synthetase component F